MKYFGKYKAISKLGEGGMAAVYLVEDTKGNKYALKELKRKYLKEDLKWKRFKNESAVIKKFSHPNVIKIYNGAKLVNIRTSNRTYKSLVYLMEYCNAKSLRELLIERNLSYAEIYSIFPQIFDSLDFCHTRQVYHRDLKPANILFKSNGQELTPVIADFGVAKIKNKMLTKYSDLTREITLLGAPAYMSPEQILDPQSIDGRSDLYSMGIILYEVVTGERPFKGNRDDLISQNLHSKPVAPSKIRPDINSSLEKFILQLLNKNAKNRPERATEAKLKLEKCTTNETTTPGTSFQNKIQISLFMDGRFIYTKQIRQLPITVGREITLEGPINKIEIPDDRVRRIEYDHFEIFMTDINTLKLKNLSKIGTIVNKRKIKKGAIDLRIGNNDIRLPDRVRFNISIKKTKQITPTMIVLIVIGIIMFMTLITVLISLS